MQFNHRAFRHTLDVQGGVVVATQCNGLQVAAGAAQVDGGRLVCIGCECVAVINVCDHEATNAADAQACIVRYRHRCSHICGQYCVVFRIAATDFDQHLCFVTLQAVTADHLCGSEVLQGEVDQLALEGGEVDDEVGAEVEVGGAVGAELQAGACGQREVTFANDAQVGDPGALVAGEQALFGVAGVNDNDFLTHGIDWTHIATELGGCRDVDRLAGDGVDEVFAERTTHVGGVAVADTDRIAGVEWIECAGDHLAVGQGFSLGTGTGDDDLSSAQTSVAVVGQNHALGSHALVELLRGHREGDAVIEREHQVDVARQVVDAQRGEAGGLRDDDVDACRGVEDRAIHLESGSTDGQELRIGQREGGARLYGRHACQSALGLCNPSVDLGCVVENKVVSAWEICTRGSKGTTVVLNSVGSSKDLERVVGVDQI